MTKALLRLVSAVLVLAAASTAEAAVVYSDTVLARGPEYLSTTELALPSQGTYQITATDLKWLDAPLSALSFGAFTATAPIKTKAGAGSLEFYYAGTGKVFLQIYARPGTGKSAGLIGVQTASVTVVPLSASVWFLLSGLLAAGFWLRLQRRAAAAARARASASDICHTSAMLFC
jgi:hypothetical protein